MQATQDSLRSRIMRLETELQNFQSSKCENPESFTRDTKVKSSIAIEGTPPKAIKSKPSTEVVYTHKSQNKKVKTKQTIKQLKIPNKTAIGSLPRKLAGKGSFNNNAGLLHES